MAEKWLCSWVSVDCGDSLGIYEGEVSYVDSVNQTISLTNVLRNNIECPVGEITLRSKDIKNLKIIRSASERLGSVIRNNEESAFVQPVKFSTKESSTEDYTKKKLDVKKKLLPKKLVHKINWSSERDEACFSAPLDYNVMNTEFDFEKNLALFDKQAVVDEINSLSKSDHSSKLGDKRVQSKFRHDENILGSSPIIKQISVACKSRKGYYTDSGLLVPSVTKEFRDQLFKKAEEYGLSTEVRLEMVGRAASEMVLQLIGGNHRMNPQNMHQKPTVIVVCGPHIQGAQGVNCGRHLANHQVNVTLLHPPSLQKVNKWFNRELNLFLLTDGSKTSGVYNLPTSVDIIVGCLDSHDPRDNCDPSWVDLARQWTKQCKAPILCVDPLPENCTLRHKWILSPVLPFSFTGDDFSVYVCDIGLPKGVFTKVESSYTSPFGSKFLIPLYSNKA